MSIKKTARLRRARRPRAKIRSLNVVRLAIHRTPKHIYAQVIESGNNSDQILATASTLDKELKEKNVSANIEGAKQVGRLVAERAKAKGIESVAFDRSGFKYHGRVKALADGAREAGLEF